MTRDRALDTTRLRQDFPILGREVNGHRLVYLDSAGSAQKPRQVLDAMDDFYRRSYANVHRGAYTLANEASEALESAREKVAHFIGAGSPNEVIFTKNATEAMNLVVNSWGRANLRDGDVVVLTVLEHHANIVPWQILADQIEIELRWVPLDHQGHLDLTALDELVDGAKVVSFSAMSNVLGTLTPVRRIADAARAAGAMVMVDACQFVPHNPTDVAELGADFIAFSAHKMCGPTGIGALWGREAMLDAMPPFLGGGSMISDVRLDGFTPAPLPHKFEAGTPPIAEAVGFGAAVDYLSALGMDSVRRHEVELTSYALRTLTERFGDQIAISGPSEPAERGGVFSLAYRDLHPHDISQVLDERAVCIRAGHHCAKPLMRYMGVGATARASVYVYNDESDIDALSEGLEAAGEFFAF
ncbi:MAG: SufS family cysteine desulfurase [Actinobacteria bacterium]|nr:MAG: SufS family cysteine desulfurase [Actinomycetota bacterium]RIK04253.1 MAG: cysteine desulfurase [Acidobacteriota bacterium]